MKGGCAMGMQRVKFSSQASPEALSAMREIARGEGRLRLPSECERSGGAFFGGEALA